MTAGAPSIPHALREQLAVGARLVIPVGPRYQQDLVVVERRGQPSVIIMSASCETGAEPPLNAAFS